MGDSVTATSMQLRKVFESTYTIPTYQRDYAWQPGDQVKTLWEDLQQHIVEHPEDDYFLGPLVVTDDHVPDLIDGQQRLITLYLLQAAFRIRLLELGGEAETIAVLSQSLSRYDEDSGTFSPSLRHHDPMVNNVLLEICRAESNQALAIRNLRGSNASISHRRVVHAFRFLIKAVDGLGNDASQVASIIKKLRKLVVLISIRATDVRQAIYVFERANSRGKVLDPSDLLKNLIFQQFDGDFDVLGRSWRALQVTVDGIPNVQMMDFLRWYHLGISGGFYATATNFVKRAQEFVSGRDPSSYLEEMSRRASALKSMSQTPPLLLGTDGLTEASVGLSGIREIGRGRQKSHWPLMTAVSNWEASNQAIMAAALERLIVSATIVQLKTQDVERTIREFTIRARDEGESGVVGLALALHAAADSMRRENLYDQRFEQLSYEEHPSVVRYILRKIHSGLYSEYQNLPATSADAGSSSFEMAEIEHIWPQSDGGLLDPEDESAVHRIGNLTLLSRAINAHGGAQQAVKKLEKVYPQEETKYLVAVNLNRRLALSGDHAHARAVDLTPTGFDSWGKEQISKLAAAYKDLLDRYLPALRA